MISDILVALQKFLACMLQDAMRKPIKVSLDCVSRDKETVSGSLVITLLRIEEETSRRSQNYYAAKEDARYPKSPDIDLNLEILISSPAEPYETSLQLISNVISAINSIRTVRKPEGLPDDSFQLIRSVTLSLVGLSFDQNLSMWQTLGGTLVPSVVYKIRTLTMEGVLDASDLRIVERVTVDPAIIDPVTGRTKTTTLPPKSMKAFEEAGEAASPEPAKIQ